MFKALFTSVALLAVTGATTASADDASRWRGVARIRLVEYNDLDLGRRDDRIALLARIEAASVELCRGVTTISARRDCVRESMEGAVARAPERPRLALQAMMGEALELAQR